MKEELNVARQGYAGLLWSKQFYNYVIRDWLNGDPGQPAPPPERNGGRNARMDAPLQPRHHLDARQVGISVVRGMGPGFPHDPILENRSVLRQEAARCFSCANGTCTRTAKSPAYEFAFGDVNPPVHAWAAWRVYKMTGPRGQRDRAFLESTFQKLLLNFTWWVNRKDAEGNNLFSGGFLGLDNIGVFDRSKPLPTGGFLQQADGTAWMGFYCLTMLSMALELAARESGLRRHGLEVLRALHRHRRRHEHDRRHRSVGRGRRLLLR